MRVDNMADKLVNASVSGDGAIINTRKSTVQLLVRCRQSELRTITGILTTDCSASMWRSSCSLSFLLPEKDEQDDCFRYCGRILPLHVEVGMSSVA